MDLARALQFLYRMLGRPDPAPGDACEIDTDVGPVIADHYRPARPWCTVLLLHGLALRAHRDPRLTTIGNALAGVGVHAIAPRLDALARLRLEPPAANTIAGLLTSIREVQPVSNRIGVFGPSYAGSQALVAAARPDLRDAVSAMLLIGPYADARQLLRHVLHDNTEDAYGRLILLRHFLGVAEELTTGLQRAIDANLADLAELHEHLTLPDVLDTLDYQDRERFLALRDHVSVRDALAQRILEQHGPEVDSLSITHALSRVEAPLVLLHGAHDPVIPPSESALIHRTVSTRGGSSRLVTTPLLDHGNVMARGRALLDVPRVVSAFARWFGALRRRR